MSACGTIQWIRFIFRIMRHIMGFSFVFYFLLKQKRTELTCTVFLLLVFISLLLLLLLMIIVVIIVVVFAFGSFCRWMKRLFRFFLSLMLIFTTALICLCTAVFVTPLRWIWTVWLFSFGSPM